MTYNNMVGIKAELLNKSWTDCGLSVWPGKKLGKKTPEEYGGRMVTVDAEFRKYDNIEQSFADFLCFMTWGSNYGKGGVPKYGPKVLTIKDPETLIRKVKELGYATGSTYPTSVMRIVRAHNLTQYDNLDGVTPTSYYPGANEGKKEEIKMAVTKPVIVNRVTVNQHEVPAHNANSHRYLAIHYLGVNGENPDLYGGGYGGHFYVSKTGVCYQAALVTDKLWHVGASAGFHYIHPDARNTNTIGIECATYSENGKWYFTEATQKACAHLAAWIMQEYNIPLSNLLMHGEITDKHCPSPYIDNPGDGPNWTWKKFKDTVAAYLGEGVPEEEGVYKVEFRQIHKGDNNEDVGTLQICLRGRDYKGADGQPIKVDKDFGENTEFALLQFQRDHGLKPDGWCGPLTWPVVLGKQKE
jgi:N-acetyl-anhydromuramyl-L-alanine amidase AmpD